MPNWCWNELTVEGPEEELARFRRENDGGRVLSFEAHLPTPDCMMTNARTTRENVDGSMEEILGMRPPTNWFSWRCRKWGTKSDAVEPNCEEAPGMLKYGFNTAWGPPVEWLTSVSKEYPGLSFRLEYREEGCDFKGWVTVQGDSTDEWEGPCESCDEEMQE